MATTQIDSQRAQMRATGVSIRPYHHPDDLAQVRRIFIDASTTGRSSPYVEGVTRLVPPTRLAGVAVALIISLEAFSFHTIGSALSLPSWVNPLRCVQGLIGGTVLTRWLYLLHLRRQFHRMFRIYINECLTGELADIVHSFNLRVTESGECVPTGPSGFWVAEEKGRVVGLVGLQSCRKDSNLGIVRRLNVAPSHQGKRVANQLLDALIAHARAHKVQVLELTTSDYNEAAMRFYEKIGWHYIGRKDYHELKLRAMRLELS